MFASKLPGLLKLSLSSFSLSVSACAFEVKLLSLVLPCLLNVFSQNTVSSLEQVHF